MNVFLLAVGIASALGWLAILALPWQPWRMREAFEARAGDADVDLGDITVLIPARDEAETLGDVLDGLATQGRDLSVIVANDSSADATAEIARTHPLAPTVIEVPALPDGWTGKLWALEQARLAAATPRLLLLDADIHLAPGTIAGLREKAEAEQRALVSLMAHLRMRYALEKLLIPAFIYLFKLLYPFALSNAGSRYVAAAAGGCVLVDADTVEKIRGFGALRDAIIDDCTLAAEMRRAGGRTWVGVTRAASSLRGYDDFAGVRDMVVRSAFTQLRYSTTLLIGATAGMALIFLAPIAALLAPFAWARITGAVAFGAMMVSYMPTLIYYRRSPAWALLLPVIGCIYLALTWLSAIRYWRGRRSAWRGRVYAR